MRAHPTPARVADLGEAALTRPPLFALQGRAISSARRARSPRARLDIEALHEGSAVGAEKRAHRHARHRHLDGALSLLRSGFADAAPVGDSALATALQRLHGWRRAARA